MDVPIGFLSKNSYDEEKICCCDSYHFLIIKTKKKSGFTSDHQIQAGFTPLVSIGQDLHPVKNLNSRFSDKRSFCRVDPWKIGMPWPVLRDSILFLSRKHFWTRNLGVRWIFQIATLQSNLLRGIKVSDLAVSKPSSLKNEGKLSKNYALLLDLYPLLRKIDKNVPIKV